MCILESIQGHQDLLKLNSKQRLELCQEIRDFLIANVSKTGGHVASNLGVVELTVALETVFDTSVDRLVLWRNQLAVHGTECSDHTGCRRTAIALIT